MYNYEDMYNEISRITGCKGAEASGIVTDIIYHNSTNEGKIVLTSPISTTGVAETPLEKPEPAKKETKPKAVKKETKTEEKPIETEAPELPEMRTLFQVYSKKGFREDLKKILAGYDKAVKITQIPKEHWAAIRDQVQGLKKDD